MSVFTKVLSAGAGKNLKDLLAFTDEVNSFEASIEPLNDDDLRSKTDEFRSRLADGEALDDIAPEAFAVVREAARRVLGQRHFDMQVVGAGAMHRGMIAEMKTGEGKTLVSTVPSYLNALGGNGVHIVTVNDYLAKRDSEWMGGILRFLGLRVGLIQSYMSPEERRPAYEADITYGTNNEFGFDYLRDNMAMTPEQMVQRGHHYGIVDEVDSILVDEARTPLIISGRDTDAAKWYRDFARIAERLQPDVHYEVDEGKRQVVTMEEGVTKVEKMLGVENMYDYTNTDLVHHLDAALRAKTLYNRDVEYLVTNGEVKIVDEFTGRILDGRRYSEGLHQAIEAKEGVKIKEENQTLATITLQNYFRLYEKLAGMTGTAATEASEFKEIYGLEVVEVPTNRPIDRADEGDLIYVNVDAKFDAVIEDIGARHTAGQPVLVGTVSIENSERISSLLKKRGIPHEVLNAKAHEREAHIIAQAGRLGAVTVATNMAGRGVDIMLGGNPTEVAESELKRKGLEPGTDAYQAAFAEAFERAQAETAAEQEKVIALGGLYVLGTERHESRRIDNQLRGRSGRQGDPGESRFYLSLTDDLMRRFASEKMASIMERLKLPPDVPIEAKMVSKAIERAQSQVESQNFEIRKNVLKYDEVMNRQREVIAEWRQKVLAGDSAKELVSDWMDEVVAEEINSAFGEDPEDRGSWDWEELSTRLNLFFPIEITAQRFGPDVILEDIVDAAAEESHVAYEKREEEITPEVLRRLEQTVILSIIDNKWREHLSDMDYLRAGIGLRAMGQKDPLVEYQREGYDMFAELVTAVKHDAIRYLFHVQLVDQSKAQQPKVQLQAVGPGGNQGATKRQAKSGDKVGRNEPCPCGSGKKYKRCHGAAA